MKSSTVLRNTALGLFAALSLTAMAAAPAAGEGCDYHGWHGGTMYGMAGAEGHHGGRMGHGPMAARCALSYSSWAPGWGICGARDPRQTASPQRSARRPDASAATPSPAA